MDIEPLEFTDADREAFFQFLKRYRPPRMYHLFKRLIQFPEYYPAINDFRVSDGKIYILTYKRDRENTRSEFIIMSLDGKLQKRVFLPFVKKSPVHPFPFAVRDGKLYQVVDNDETETWELRITPF